MAYIYDLTDTWNAGGTTFNAIKMNVTDSASAAGSKLVTLQTNGTEHFSVTKAGVGYFSGNVGIGTASPTEKLVLNSAGNVQVATKYINGNTTGVTIGAGADGSAFVYQAAAQPFIVYTNAAERMRIDGSGNVGIGTSSPLSAFTVNGAISASAGNAVRFYNSGNTNWSEIVNPGGGQMALRSGGGEAMRIDGSSNVGIGTSSPTGISGYTALKINNATNGAILDLAQADTVRGRLVATAGSFTLETTGSIPLTFAPGATERMRIDSSGNLLVGTTSAVSRSSVSSRFISVAPSGLDAACVRQGENTSFALVSHVSTTSGTRYHIGFGDGASWTERGTITTNGTSTSYNTSSDARLKENIADADNASSLIDAIRVRKFDWKATGSHQRYGMIAQELLEVAPEAVSHDPDDEEKMMGVDYSKLVPMLVKEIQSLRARVAQLEGK